jgi:hypothetical protein
MMALAAVWIAATVTTVAGLVWMLATHAWERVSVRRWDRGVDL